MNIPVPILPSKYDWKVGHCMENKHKTLQAVEKKEDQPGALGTEGWHGGKIPWVFFLSHTFRLGPEESGKPENTSGFR